MRREPADRLDIRLVSSPSAPRMARRAVSELLARVGRPDLTADCVLLVSELVTNSVVHAGGTIAVTATYSDHALRVEVQDLDPRIPVPEQPDVLGESGRGLWLVDAIALRWSIEPRLGGKKVWFELR